MSRIYEKAILEKLAKRTGISNDEARWIYHNLRLTIQEELADGNELVFFNFGVFEAKVRRGYILRWHGDYGYEDFVVPARRNVVFRAGKEMREAVNEEPLPDWMTPKLRERIGR